MQALFAWQLGNPSFQTRTSLKIVKQIKEIDGFISKNAPKWPLDKINHLDLAVLRLATWELLYSPDTPPKVVADEAVEIAKEFGSESSSSFVNGVLGAILTNLGHSHTQLDKNSLKAQN